MQNLVLKRKTMERKKMTLKETYEEMSDEELLEKFKHFQRYRDESKLIMLEELRKRKLVGDEEILEKKIDLEKKQENQNNTNKPNEKILEQQTKLPIVQASLLSRGLLILLIGGLFFVNLSVIKFIFGISTLSWTETKAKIVKIEQFKKTKIINNEERMKVLYVVKYEYIVDGVKYTNDRIQSLKTDEQAFKYQLTRERSEGDDIQINYNPNNPSESLVYKYSLKELLWGIFGLFLIFLFYLSVKKTEKDFNIKTSKKSIVITIVVLEIIIFGIIFLID